MNCRKTKTIEKQRRKKRETQQYIMKQNLCKMILIRKILKFNLKHNIFHE